MLEFQFEETPHRRKAGGSILSALFTGVSVHFKSRLAYVNPLMDMRFVKVLGPTFIKGNSNESFSFAV